MWWERHREKLLLQETCYFDWQNLIAEASRRGFFGQEELQWDSYKILSEQLEQERLESIEGRRRTTGVKGDWPMEEAAVLKKGFQLMDTRKRGKINFGKLTVGLHKLG
ncbi:hypothetical protein Vadar_026816 [Vaccinium darrowii]|uniref:Uncharacterized protein n=1 Tax=Vaccinium darrowii TaxID=229202 RepID=A0ACB7Z6H1_9ERIC|nr:hypothetical protein Vadar_026816 [Vaccinium darrowii]